MYSADNPSPRWRELISLYRQLHSGGDAVRSPAEMFPGMPRESQIPKLMELVNHHQAKSLLDYGCGKGMQWKLRFNAINDGREFETTLQDLLGIETVGCYDPGYEPLSSLPTGKFDAVICFDVLEHCPEDDLPWILDQIFSYSNKFVFANIACFPAKKLLPNGENAHCTIKPAEWWGALI